MTAVSRWPARIAAIAAEDAGTGDLFIKADELFLTEALRQIKSAVDPEAKPGEVFPIGDLSAENSKFKRPASPGETAARDSWRLR